MTNTLQHWRCGKPAESTRGEIWDYEHCSASTNHYAHAGTDGEGNIILNWSIHFPTKHLTATSLSSIMWQGIERLEFLGFKVLVVTGDGASTNRKFFRMHSSPDSVCHKTRNPYSSSGRFLYYFSDPPTSFKNNA